MKIHLYKPHVFHCITRFNVIIVKRSFNELTKFVKYLEPSSNKNSCLSHYDQKLFFKKSERMNLEGRHVCVKKST